MQAHPGVMFVTVTTGERRAALVSGPEVWKVAEAWRQHSGTEREPGVVADTLGLTRRQVEAALTYWAENRAEIDLVIERHERDQDAALAAWSRRRELDGL